MATASLESPRTPLIFPLPVAVRSGAEIVVSDGSVQVTGSVDDFSVQIETSQEFSSSTATVGAVWSERDMCRYRRSADADDGRLGRAAIGRYADHRLGGGTRRHRDVRSSVGSDRRLGPGPTSDTVCRPGTAAASSPDTVVIDRASRSSWSSGRGRAHRQRSPSPES